jgi:transcriptional regulator with XRE-family HTH domain
MHATDAWIMERAGVHRSTVARWRRSQQFPPALERLAALELEGDLALIHSAWHGWRIDRAAGALIAPGGMHLTPGELLALPVRYQLLRELERRLRPRSWARLALRRFWGMLRPGPQLDRSA